VEEGVRGGVRLRGKGWLYGGCGGQETYLSSVMKRSEDVHFGIQVLRCGLLRVCYVVVRGM